MRAPQAKKLPSGMWRVQLMINGERISITRATKKEAEQEAAFEKAAAAVGRRVVVKKEDCTIRELINAYIEEYKDGWSPLTLMAYESKRDNRFRSIIDVPYSAITSWQKAYDAESKEVSSKTLDVAWGLICSALRYAKIPVPEVKEEAVVSEERPFLYPHQLPAFLDMVREQPCEMGALLGLHGLRRSESTALRRRDVDLEHGIMHVRSEMVQTREGLVELNRTKTPKSTRPVPIMSDRLRELVAAIDDPDARLCPITPQTLYRQINRLCEQNGFGTIGTHGLRSGFCAMCFKREIPAWRTKEIGGWSSIAIVEKHYAHFRKLHVAYDDPRLEGMLNGE